MCVCMYICMYVCVCVCVRASARVRLCVRVILHCKRVLVTVGDCRYHDTKDSHYMGTKQVTNINSSGNTSVHNCQSWSVQTGKPDSSFPDGSRKAAVNFCRNPDNDKHAWCYYNTALNWAYCTLQTCGTY